MNKKPIVSVVLPVFNAEAYVREAVKSILDQSLDEFELIILNDGSSDGSSSILRELSEIDARICLIERENIGLVDTLNEGIAIARGDFIARMDADDIAVPERLSVQLAKMTSNPSLGVLGSFIRIINKEGDFIRRGEYPVTEFEVKRFLEYGSPLAHPSVMMRRDAVVKVGGYRKVFAHCEDYDLWLRISELGYGIANLPEILLSYRVHGANVSAVHREAQELGTVVARLAHRVRKVGLPDPVEGVDLIDLKIIEKVPAYLRQDIDADFLALRYSNVSLLGIDELKRSWREYRNLGSEAKKNKVMCGFLLRMFNGALRNNTFSIAAMILIELIYMHPGETVTMLWFKAKLILTRSTVV